MRPVRAPLLLAAVLAALSVAGLGGARFARAAEPNVSSLGTSPITIYGAKWCSACRSLEAGLSDRKISFAVVDVDESPAAFARARAASGKGGAIPLTSVERQSGTVWIVGADVEGVERAQRGD
jgi:mycoredoxin